MDIKRYISMCLIMLLLFTFAACQPTPSEEAVIGKNEDSLEEMIQKTAAPPSEETTSEPNENVTAGRWEQTIEAGKAIIDINADIIRPLSKYAVLKVIQRDFTKEDVQRAIKLFAGDAKLSNYTPQTKDRIMNEILAYRKYISDIEAGNYFNEDGKTAEEQIEEYENIVKELAKKYETAPESEISNVALNTDFVEDDYSKAVKLYFQDAEQGGKTLIVRNFAEENSTLMRYMDEDVFLASYEEMTESEQEAAISNGLPGIDEVNDFLSAYFEKLEIGRCHIESYKVESREKEGKTVPVYSIYYSKDYGNGEISFVAPRQSQLSSDDPSNIEYALPHEPEIIRVITDGKTVYSFTWSMPHSVLEVVNDNAATLETEEVKSLLEEQLTRILKGENTEQSIKITQVKMSYCYLRNQKDNTYLVIPVWDMMGYESRENEEEEKRDLISFVTLNAIDGTVINRTLGY